MSGFSKITLAVDAFNRHGRLTARAVENDLAVEIRDVDTGQRLTTVWAPTDSSHYWFWPQAPGSGKYEFCPSTVSTPEFVRVVAASILDEGVNR
jgi:hypothetical protein